MTSLKRKLGDICSVCSSRIETFQINLDCEIEMCSNLQCFLPFNLPATSFIYNVPFDKHKWFINVNSPQLSSFTTPKHSESFTTANTECAKSPKKAKSALVDPSQPSKATTKSNKKMIKPPKITSAVQAMPTPTPPNPEEQQINSAQLDLDNIPNILDFLASPISVETPFDITKDIHFIDTVGTTEENKNTISSNKKDIGYHSPKSTTANNINSTTQFDPVITQLLDQFSDITQHAPPSVVPKPSPAFPSNLALPPLSAARTVVQKQSSTNYSISELEKFLHDI
ncbi:uncharacterized protein BX663DRAFT_551649 [Cokeromyces recurvatus]|uniref:uncharacterized protein n=1 Tax=Cokeromyces recurvatus TaxID=90255 RepID=UPI00222037FE|nr:uncharacterized protein BX663DRAFT_551649 [Cokeromyces recurvatus]KAI7903372.1 hypothetical protein BX663DRAFT_551649 [Cokeromyces recurvatus]